MSKKRVAKIEKRISAMLLMHKKHMKREKILYTRIDAGDRAGHTRGLHAARPHGRSRA